MATESKNVFLLGPGFVGGEILDALLKDGYNVTTMVRRKEAAKPLEDLGVKVVFASLSDLDIITAQAAEHPIIINTASSDDPPSVDAILAGIKNRTDAGKSTIYIHTSGTGVIADNSAGGYKSDKVWDDEDPADIDTLPDDAPHRPIDLAILRAREQLGTKAKMAIIMPPVIYGVSSREKRTSMQLPCLTRFALKHGYAGHVGEGLSEWGFIHVSDLARAFLIVLHWLESDASNEIHKNPYFFAENGFETSWGNMVKSIGKELQAVGKLDSAEPKSISKDLYGDLMGPWTDVALGSNARNRANRLRKLGWKPEEKSYEASLREDEVPRLV